MGQGGTVPCWLSFATPVLTDVDGLSASFFTTGGNVDFSALASSTGGHVTGSLAAAVSWSRYGGLDGQGNSIYEHVTGTITGAFDLTLQ